MAKMAAAEDAFRKAFKLYKRRNPPPDLGDVLDFSASESRDPIVPIDLHTTAVSDEDAARAGLRPVSQWRACGLRGFPGFIFICDPFLRGCQAFWLTSCLKTYPQKPNVCNLDLHMAPADTQDIWGRSAPALSRPDVGPRRPKTLLERLRWVTLGFHYDWDTKTYSPERQTPFPPDLALLSRHVAAACGFPRFSAEAGILNYYGSDSSLGIHVDESELDLSSPLLSFSFGQSAVFLLGGLRRQDAPAAMFMHSGDVMVMSGPSRLLYHAVPRILPPPPWRPAPDGEAFAPLPDGAALHPVPEEDWAVCSRYGRNSRVNMTIRQVVAPGQVLPPPQSVERKRTRSGAEDPET